MIAQAILVTVVVVVLMDTGRCMKSKSVSTCLSRCEDLRSHLSFGTSSYCNLDSSFLVACNYSYKPPKPFLNLGSNISLDGKFIPVSYLASKFYDYTSLHINNSISEVSEGVDGKKDDPQRSISFCIYLGFLAPAVGVSWIIWRRWQKKVVKLRRGLFVRNGGELLEAQQPMQKTFSLFTAEDLKKATNNYDEINVLSQEHHPGITYKGILPGTNSGVTIQFCHAFDRCKIEALVTKLVTLSQVSHRNVVRLLGCCLETQIPLLVYESITGKTLFDHINDDYLSWDVRLRIAADTAGALAYLHSATIIHGALSISCILLDHAYNVKLKGLDLKCLNCSCVELYGDTSIYSDPDLFSSGQLIEKGDVYSFGFVLVEMLTQKGVMSLEEEEKLAKCISGTNRDDELLEILDDSIVTDDNAGKLREVGEIAKICLSSSSHERPTMKEVALALDECIKNRD